MDSVLLLTEIFAGLIAAGLVLVALVAFYLTGEN